MQLRKVIIKIAAAMAAPMAIASTYNLPAKHDSIVGLMRIDTPAYGENATTVSQRYNIGLNALKAANPDIDIRQDFINQSVVVPTMHLLPEHARKGIVINLPEMRLYYYPPKSHEVLTYPIGIGKIGQTIPIRRTKVIRKAKNPYWFPPKSIIEFNKKKGIELPKKMAPGPDNPLGTYAIYMGIPTYLIHSTIYPESIGKRASFGCIRMNEDDIEEMYPAVKSGVPIAIVNEPVKLGWEDEQLYLEVHPSLKEHKKTDNASLPDIVHRISQKIKNHPALIDWQMVSYIAKDKDGVPHDIGTKL